MNLKEEYSPFKAAYHIDRILKLRCGQPISPVHVQLVISDLCNQDCNFCAYRQSNYTSSQLFSGESDNKNPRRFISYDKIIEILDDCVEMDVRAIQLTGGGEPTVHPNFVGVLENILCRGLDLALVTNGVLIDRANTTELLVNARWVRISVDAGSANTYSQIRGVPPAIFNKVMNNIQKLVEMRNKKATDCTIGVGFVVTPENYFELYQAVKEFKQMGVDNVRISAVFSNDGYNYYGEHLYKVISEIAIKAKQDFQDEKFTIFNNFPDRVADMQNGSPVYTFCPMIHLQTYIGADMNIYTCCVYAYNERGLLASIKNQSFKIAWRDSYNKLRGFSPRECKHCMYNDKNLFINYLIKNPPPKHVNFV